MSRNYTLHYENPHLKPVSRNYTLHHENPHLKPVSQYFALNTRTRTLTLEVNYFAPYSRPFWSVWSVHVYVVLLILPHGGIIEEEK